MVKKEKTDFIVESRVYKSLTIDMLKDLKESTSKSKIGSKPVGSS